MSDEAVEELLSEDLTEYLTPENFKENFVSVSFEIAPDEEVISIKLSKKLLESIKMISEQKGVEYQTLIEELIEQGVQRV
jgi:predicted DNA binding CopG/RHH family protein